MIRRVETICIQWLRAHSIAYLRIALGIVFLWFGALKLIGVSPVVGIIAKTYSFLPTYDFVMVLGFWEMAIGIGLLGKVGLRITVELFLLQMSGTFVALVLNPSLFFADGNFFLLTTEGEFVVKNIVLVAAGLVIAGHELEP